MRPRIVISVHCNFILFICIAFSGMHGTFSTPTDKAPSGAAAASGKSLCILKVRNYVYL